SMVVCNDHEEVGSVSAAGAQGTFLKSVLSRCLAASDNSGEALERCVRKSVMLSVDNTHGVHPNFTDKHDDKHCPLLNGGPAIKVNANQRYASNSDSIALFRALCDEAGIEVQQFVSRADLACGSTIGPLTAAEIGIPTVDLGVATFAMHSIRELGGSRDPALLQQAMTLFFNRGLA
ncbi:MAG: M18 family aminopeptidase, partial [Gammaproteobacteria bacterium]